MITGPALRHHIRTEACSVAKHFLHGQELVKVEEEGVRVPLSPPWMCHQWPEDLPLGLIP